MLYSGWVRGDGGCRDTDDSADALFAASDRLSLPTGKEDDSDSRRVRDGDGSVEVAEAGEK